MIAVVVSCKAALSVVYLPVKSIVGGCSIAARSSLSAGGLSKKILCTALSKLTGTYRFLSKNNAQ